MDNLKLETELTLPALPERGTKSLAFPALLVLLIFSVVFFFTDDGASQVGSLLFGGFIVLSIIVNILDINQRDKPLLSMNQQGFRFGHHGMREIPWSAVKSVGFERVGADKEMMASVIIKTDNDKQWFPQLSFWPKLFLRFSIHYEWPKIGLKLPYDQARVFSIVASSLAGLDRTAVFDDEFHSALKQHFSGVVRFGDGESVGYILEKETAIPATKTSLLSPEIRRCPECYSAAMHAVERQHLSWGLDEIYQCENCGNSVSIMLGVGPYVTGLAGLALLVPGFIFDWYFLVIVMGSLLLLSAAFDFYTEWRYPVVANENKQ